MGRGDRQPQINLIDASEDFSPGHSNLSVPETVFPGRDMAGGLAELILALGKTPHAPSVATVLLTYDTPFQGHKVLYCIFTQKSTFSNDP